MSRWMGEPAVRFRVSIDFLVTLALMMISSLAEDF